MNHALATHKYTNIVSATEAKKSTQRKIGFLLFSCVIFSVEILSALRILEHANLLVGDDQGNLNGQNLVGNLECYQRTYRHSKIIR
jgi:hypothetical protein